MTFSALRISHDQVGICCCAACAQPTARSRPL